MLRLIAKVAGFLAYFLITLEMLFMVTPFALYYYSAYRPLLTIPSAFAMTAWLPAFFLPHLSSDIFPNAGNLIFLLGLIGFLIGAIQVYRAKFTRRGVVAGGLYKRIRHPQYLFLGVAGLGLLITWPRFILLIIYVHMLWFYYILARSEEDRMEIRFGDAYRKVKHATWMFLPREPGGFLQRHLFGWIPARKTRLVASYVCSLIVAIGIVFLLRGVSLAATSHTVLETSKTAAISFVNMPETDLRDIVRSAGSAEEVQSYKIENRWILVQVMFGKGSVVHTLMDAGMTHKQAGDLHLTPAGMKLVFSKEAEGLGHQPFGTRTRWQPALIVEMSDRTVLNKIVVAPSWFPGNPVMPIF